MSEATPPQEWPTDWRQAVLLLLILFAIVFRFGQSTSERLTIAVGAIRLHPPMLVPLDETETATAVGLLGGAIEEYLAQSDDGTPA
jgi:hypothetical protein